MSLQLLAQSVVVAIILAAVVAPSTQAFDWDAWRAEREAARIARDAEQAAEEAAEEAEKQQEEQKEATACTCSASLSLGKPSLQWSSAGLMFTPRVDFSLRGRGGDEALPLNAKITYNGSTQYSSEDVTVPSGITFGGEKPVASGFPCQGTYRGSGIDLTPVKLSGFIRSLIGVGQEVKGLVRMKASIEGCGFDQEERQISFTLKELGNLRLGLWGSVR